MNSTCKNGLFGVVITAMATVILAGSAVAQLPLPDTNQTPAAEPAPEIEIQLVNPVADPAPGVKPGQLGFIDQAPAHFRPFIGNRDRVAAFGGDQASFKPRGPTADP